MAQPKDILWFEQRKEALKQEIAGIDEKKKELEIVEFALGLYYKSVKPTELNGHVKPNIQPAIEFNVKSLKDEVLQCVKGGSGLTSKEIAEVLQNKFHHRTVEQLKNDISGVLSTYKSNNVLTAKAAGPSRKMGFRWYYAETSEGG